jgi:hypothetical protein
MLVLALVLVLSTGSLVCNDREEGAGRGEVTLEGLPDSQQSGAATPAAAAVAGAAKAAF